MDYETKLRNRASMVIYELEKSLGELCSSNLTDINEIGKDMISGVEKYNHVNDKIETVDQLIKASYLNDIFNLALVGTKKTNLNTYLKQFKKKCDDMDLFDIRNSLSHATRTFHENYWYKLCALVTDPLLSKIKLDNVYSVFQASLEDKFELPPSEWMNKKLWYIENNLPERNDYDVTGFIGRKKDISQIKRKLLKGRHSLLSIVAPGGYGKTALAIQLLDDISNSYEFKDEFEKIVYVTMKTEKLTCNGIEKITASTTINDLSVELIKEISSLYNLNNILTMEDLCVRLKNNKILICIDNLETLIATNQDDFLKFIDMLPSAWKIVVTSRIVIDSFDTTPLDHMEEGDTIELVRRYSLNKGISDLDYNSFKDISKKMNYNPLAIRLTIDAFSLGEKLSDSIKKVSEDVVAFSYSNLVDRLDNKCVSILEALFLETGLSREDIAGILELSLDDVSTGIAKLRKTSLIKMDFIDDKENYILSESIKEYMLLNEVNYKVRLDINKKLKQKKIDIENIKFNLNNTNENSFWFCRDDIDESLLKIFDKIKRGRKKPTYENCVNWYKQLSSLNDSSHNYFEYWALLSYVANKLGDNTRYLEASQKYVEFKGEDYPSLYNLACCYFYAFSDYEKSIEILSNIIDRYSNDLDKYSLNKLYSMKFKCLIYLKRNDELIDLTKYWKTESNDVIKSNMGMYRVWAIKRNYENSIKENKIEDLINRCINLFEEADCIDLDMKPVDYVKIFTEIVNEFIYLDKREETCLERLTNSDKSKILKFILKFYYSEITNKVDKSEVEELLIKYNWLESNSIVFEEFDMEDINKDSIEISVYEIPNKFKTYPLYIFASSLSGQQFFLHFDNCNNLDWKNWKKIEIGNKFIVSNYEYNGSDKAIEAIEFYYKG